MAEEIKDIRWRKLVEAVETLNKLLKPISKYYEQKFIREFRDNE